MRVAKDTAVLPPESSAKVGGEADGKMSAARHPSDRRIEDDTKEAYVKKSTKSIGLLWHNQHQGEAPHTDDERTSAREVYMCWEFVPLLSCTEERVSPEAGTVINFNTSLCSLLLGDAAHKMLFNSFRKYRRTVRLSVLLYNVGLASVVLTLLVGEAAGSYLAIFSLLCPLLANVQVFLGLNPSLLKIAIRNVQFWAISLLILVMWSTAGIMLGGIRGCFLSVGGMLIDTMAGPLKDSYHFRFRSPAIQSLSYVLGLIYHMILAGSMVFRVFRGGTLLRWDLGSRELTGEDIVVNCAGTLVIYVIPWITQGVHSIKRRLSRGKKQQGQDRGPRRRRLMTCPTLQWQVAIRLTSRLAKQQVSGRGISSSERAGFVRDNNRLLPSSGSPTPSCSEGLAPLIISTPKDLFVQEEETRWSCFSTKTIIEGHSSVRVLPSKRLKEKSGSNRATDVSRTESQQTNKTTCEAPLLNGLVPSSKHLIVQLVVALGVWMIPAALYLGMRQRSCQCETSGSLSSSLSLSNATLAWNAASFLYLVSLWNNRIVRLICRYSFDFWFLVLQTAALLLSLSDAFQYDERSVVLLAWCLLYLACLFSDAILPSSEGGRSGRRELCPISKRFLGLAVLFPLLSTQCWFLYELVFGDGSLQLRSRKLFHIVKHLEEGVQDGDQLSSVVANLDITNDSFIVARLTCIVAFSLPLLYHLLVASSLSSFYAYLPAPSAAVDGQKLVATNEETASLLYFINGSVSYEAPLRNVPVVTEKKT